MPKKTKIFGTARLFVGRNTQLEGVKMKNPSRTRVVMILALVVCAASYIGHASITRSFAKDKFILPTDARETANHETFASEPVVSPTPPDQPHPGRISGGVAPIATLEAASALAITYTPNVLNDPDVSVTHSVRTSDGHIITTAGNVDTGQVSLRSAIIAANNNAGADTITLGSNTYTLSIPAGTASEPAQPGVPTIGDVDVTTSGLTINGNGPALTTIQQTSGIDRVIDVNPPYMVGNFFFTLNGVTITGGRSTSGDAGGLYSGSNDTGLMTKGKITINNCVFKNNTVTNPGFGGGGMQNFGGDLDVINTTFGGPGPTDPNSAQTSGGGLAAVGATNAHTITISGVTFTNNVSVNAGSGGGGLDLAANGAQSNGTTALVTNCAFTGNQAQGTGSGGAMINEVLIATVTNTQFTNNTSNNRGGGIANAGGSLHLNSSSGNITFTGNTAPIHPEASSIYTASAVTVSGTNVAIGGSIEVSSGGSWTNNTGSTLSPTNVLITGGTLKLNNSTMNIGGNLTIQPAAIAGATFTGDSGTINITGNLTTTSGGSGPVTSFNGGTGTFNFNGSGAQAIGGTLSPTFFNLTDSNTTQPLVVNNSPSVNGTLNVSGVSAILSPVAASVIGGTGTLTGNGTARVTRATGTNDFLTQYTITGKTLINLLVDYFGPGAQGISGTTYTNVRLNNSSGGTLSAAATVNGTLTLASGAFNVGTSTLTLNNVITPAGGSLTSGATGTVNYNQSSIGQQVIAGTYGNLTFSNFTKVLAGTGTIGIAGTFTPGNAVGHTIAGSTINFNGTGAQTIPAFNYNNLTSSSTGARTLSNTGTIGIAGAFTPGTNAYTITGSTVDYNGTGAQTVAAFNYNNLTSSSSGARTLANSGTIGVANTFTAGSNAYTIAGSTINFNGTGSQTIPAFNYNNLTSSSTGARTLAGAGTIGIAGVFTPGAGNAYTNTGSTIDFNGGGAQTIPAFIYNHLTSSNSGARTLANSGTIGIFGNFTPGGNTYTITGSTINFNGTSPQNIPAFNYNNLTSSSTGARTLANTGTIGVAGTFTPGTNAYSVTGSTISFNGPAQPVAVFLYNNMSTAGSGIKSLTGATTVAADLTIGAGTTLDVTPSNFALNVGGNWTNNGSFTQRAGSVTLNGSSLQTISGSSLTTFNNLIINNASGVTLGQNAAVNGLLTLTAGAFNIGTNILTLNNGTSVGAGSLNGANGTTNYNQGSGGQVVLAGQYNNLIFSNFSKVLPNGGTISISGTFTPGGGVGHTITNSTIDFNGSGPQTIPAFNYFNLTSSSSGARTLANAGTIGIAGAFTPGTNAYTVTGSTVAFNGAGAQSVPVFTFNNLATATSGTKTQGGAVTAQAALTIGSGTTLDCGGFGLTVGGGWTNNGSFVCSSGTVIFNGAAPQTVGGSNPTNFNGLTINNGSGVSFSFSTTVNNLVLTSGNVLMGANTMTIGTAGTAVHTSGHVIGTLNKMFSGPGAFTYPTGTANGYSPVDVTVTTGSGSLSILANSGVQPVLAPQTGRMLQRYWTLNGSGITSNVVFHYLDADVPGAPSVEANYNVFRVVGSTPLRFVPDGVNVILNAAGNTFTINSLSNYSDWTAGDPLAPTAAPAGISGRVLRQDGRGVPFARVALTDSDGNTVYSVANSFGYYRFVNVETGRSYVMSVTSKSYRFGNRAISLTDNVVGLDFIAIP
jgi:hypothetical protein